MAVTTRRQCLGGGTALGAGLLAAACDVVGGAGGEVAPDATQETRPAIAKPPGSGLPRQTQRQIPVLARFVPTAFGTLSVDQFHEYTAPFTEAHPHLTIEWQSWHDHSELYQGFREAIATGQAGDVMYDLVSLPRWLGDSVPPLVMQGALLGLNQFIRRDRYDLADFWPGCLERSTWRGDLYALHTHADTQLVFYNQNLLAAAGVSAPPSDWTWQHLLDRARELTRRQRAKPVYGFALSRDYSPYEGAVGGEYSYPATIPWIWANGGDLVDADLTKSLVDEPPAREALEWLFEQRDTHAVWPSADEVNGDELFKIGRLAMLYGPRSFTGHVDCPASPIRAAVWPGGGAPWPGQAGQLALRAMGVPSGRRDQRAGRGLDLPQLVGRGEAQRAFQQGTARKGPKLTFPTMPPPARRSVAQSVAPWFGGDPIVPALEHARDLPLHPARVKLLQVYDEGLAPVWEGKQSVAVATAAIAKAQNAILAG